MKKVILFSLLLVQFAACMKDPNANNTLTNDEPIVVITDAAKGAAAAGRGTCILYCAIRYRDGDDLTTANTNACAIKYRLIQKNISTGVETAVSPYLTSSSTTGRNISWVVSDATGYRYFVAYDQCESVGNVDPVWIHTFWADVITVQSDPLGYYDVAGSQDGEVPANSNPDVATQMCQIGSSCSVIP